MAIDTGVVEARGDLAGPRGPGWRPRTVIASILAVALAVAAVWGYVARSTPHVVLGSTILGGHGVKELTDGVEVTRWQQTSGQAWVAWTVRNDGADAVILTAAGDPNLGPNVMPRLTSGFLAQLFPYGGTPPQLDASAGPTVTDLQQSVSVEPGDEVYVVAEVYYPDSCLLRGAAVAAGGRYTIDGVGADARVLGRTTRVELPLPRPLETPIRSGACDEALFAGR
jgi:hypothetical protein